MATRYDPRETYDTTVPRPATEQTLYGVTEIVRGSAASVLKRVNDLRSALRPSPEKIEERPERSHESPADIALNAYDDLHEAEGILDNLIAWVGRAGRL